MNVLFFLYVLYDLRKFWIIMNFAAATLPTSSPFLLPSAPPLSYRSNFDFPEAVPEVPDIIVEGGR